ncbi:tRNA adenosine(34) deaminase TadA [Gammaproteobacteria bacterium LSUCC0112]|nr:tRNA adenosine(34) deaminase TadA [Gammaproteobacteria bacterium LSUCC0112]
MGINPEDIAFMREALRLAQQAADAGEVPVGALIVQNGQVIGRGYNQPVKTHDPSAHAEICALRAAGQVIGNYRLPDATLYVTIEPCTMCYGAIIHARIKRLVFGAAEPKYGAVLSGQKLLENGHFNHSPDVLSGVLEQDCSLLMRQFFASKRRQAAQAQQQ